MAFTPINFDEGKVIDLGAAAATYTKGQALTYASGNVSTASAGQNGEVFAVSMENKVIGTAGDPLKCIITRGVKFLADCTANPAQTDVGTECDLGSATALTAANNTDNLFYIESVVMPLASKKVVGYFKHENPNS